MSGRRAVMTRSTLVGLSLVLVATCVLETSDAWARASSGGSRGSRSYSSPSRSPSPVTPTSPSRSMAQPTPMTPAPARPSFFGGLMGAVAGFALGGLIGSMLFGGLGHGIGLL